MPMVMQQDLWLVNAKAIITLGNVILLLCLLVIYAKNYEQIKSKFALGLIAFVILLIMHALTSNPVVPYMWGHHRMYYDPGVFVILPDLFEFVALLILLYISLRPD